MSTEPGFSALDPERYCRDIESYLCRKNDGHLIRIVGPAFEQVCGWARRGVPQGVAHRGIDRYFERYYAKGPRRRPVRIEFCEADVLDAFDEWRRALGISAALPDPDESGQADGEQREAGQDAGRKHGSLPAHLERVIARLTSLRAGEHRDLDALLDDTVRELDAARGGAKGLRGQAREAFLQRLAELDRQLLDRARSRCDEAALAALRRDADDELMLFRDRMPRDAYAKSHEACVDRLLRERLRLPVIAYDA